MGEAPNDTLERDICSAKKKKSGRGEIRINRERRRSRRTRNLQIWGEKWIAQGISLPVREGSPALRKGRSPLFGEIGTLSSGGGGMYVEGKEARGKHTADEQSRRRKKFPRGEKGREAD